MPLPFRRILAGLLLVVVQWLILGELQLWGAMADGVLIYIVWIGLRHGPLHGSITGFGLGFLLDAIYGTWGIQMFVKTLVGFILGLFPANERETLLILPQQAFVGTLVIALLHNGLTVIFMTLLSGTRTIFLITSLWLGSALYTAIVGTVASLFSTR